MYIDSGIKSLDASRMDSCSACFAQHIDMIIRVAMRLHLVIARELCSRMRVRVRVCYDNGNSGSVLYCCVHVS